MSYGPYDLTSYPCAICGSEHKRTIQKKRGAVVDREFDIVKCATCGHVYVDPRIKDEDLGSLYDDLYYQGRGFDRTIDYVGAPSREKEVEAATVVGTVVQALKKPIDRVRWIDFGCGSGMLLESAVKLGAQAVGLDESPVAQEICARKNLVILSQRDLEERKGEFDVVTALEVIEHVPDPRGFLRHLASLACAGGLIYVQTGNWNLVRHQPGTPYLMPEGHIHYFTPPIMRRLFADANIAELPVFNRSWFPYRKAPPVVREHAPIALFSAFGGVTRAVLPGYAPYPVGKRL